MKIRFLFNIVMTIILMIPGISYSYDEIACSPEISVLFGNGIWNDYKAADKSKRLLKNRLESYLFDINLEDAKITYGVAHNPSVGAISDLLEGFEQNLQTNWSSFWRYISGLDPMPDFLQDKLIEIANTIDENILRDNPAVQEHVELYNKLLRARAGKRRLQK